MKWIKLFDRLPCWLNGISRGIPVHDDHLRKLARGHSKIRSIQDMIMRTKRNAGVRQSAGEKVWVCAWVNMSDENAKQMRMVLWR